MDNYRKVKDIAKFRNINNKFVSYDDVQSEFIYETEFDGEEEFTYKTEERYRWYFNEENNNSIMFSEYRYEDEEHLSDVSLIPNYISESAYNYICNVLNNNKNITVVWSQVYGTTSDYIIIYDNIDIKSKKEVDEYIKNAKMQSKDSSYKYTEIKNGIVRKCNF